MRALIDTNILIDYLAGIEAARDELSRHHDPAISAITWMEAMVGAEDDRETARLRWFLSGFTRVPIDDDVSELAVAIRRKHRIRLPDAIIWHRRRSGHAQHEGLSGRRPGCSRTVFDSPADTIPAELPRPESRRRRETGGGGGRRLLRGILGIPCNPGPDVRNCKVITAVECPLVGRPGYFSAEYDVGSRIRASMLSTSLRSSSRSTAMMISWKSSKVPSSRHISSRASRDGYASM